ncbi:phage tail terminator protein [Pseudoalteromonas luteoviolacea]|uniref:Tail protein n=1 Tax=Pseudoalteromonas luteoviolacea S4054 TaxID=1129367 RepID=A0A0F6AFM5_9GAMM|nr:hypothetical protein [Pseudoalteromonas luteoviolacea]AOT08254.1 hypothetical protein S4054249_10555 [Pseudoalteromonas luteoviolacea]AOT13170.1 hypothetical protein S40542_10530 [Pseudoalteromonas luteoviolacea]AOT18082.1 hypothetical protein S4054_10525 [Pseudoalteromonas luteoviolacea]KKE84184.1 hypothetical protein N479_09810 [Pseudoalteromonas luteoviolacea S4054]KZN76211.1 hypothetical protein N481_07605 [Pseudoalteromonas luteoviolacea S4047-1]
MFNFDLNHIESALTKARIAKVGFAPDFNQARSKPVHTPLLYVLPLDEDYQSTNSITGQDEYAVNELFAVMIVVPCHIANRQTDTQIEQLRERVKAALAGLTVTPYEPIKLHRGRMVELNQQTKNLIYQCQFSVSGHITINTKEPT